MPLQTISHYRIIRKLGSGGMGEVYLAEDEKLQRKVAIKVLPQVLAEDEQANKRLIREAQVAATLDHPNICSVYEVGQECNQSFIIMQYIEGETLSGRIKTKPLELSESVDIAIEVADALAEAHSHGVIHRDIKPQNIILTPREKVKVLDFGLAKIFQYEQVADKDIETQSLITEAGEIVGTAAYMSPEQAKRAQVDARSDLFSLGAMLYEMTTGRRPFCGTSLMETCAQVIHVDPPMPSEINPRIPPELDRIIFKLLSKEKSRRYQSANDLIADLRSARNILQAEIELDTRSASPNIDTSQIEDVATVPNKAMMSRWLVGGFFAALVLLATWIGSLVLGRPANKPPADAIRWYNIGTRAIRDGAYDSASKALTQAINIDDDYVLAHARLAEAWLELDYTDRAKNELLRVSELALKHSVESPTDSLYFQALRETARNDFASAVLSYQKIIEKTPGEEKSYAYQDLARAQERNDDTEGAIENYETSVHLNLQCAAAFVRLGVLYGRKRDWEKADVAFEKSYNVYQALANFEGVTDALYQRSIVLTDLGKLSQAQEQLQRALNIAQAISNEAQQIKLLLQMSRLSYIEGNTVQAMTQASQGVGLARTRGSENLTTQGLIDIGNALFARREYEKAEEYFKRAYDFANMHKGRRNEAIAALSLAKLYVQQERNTDEGLHYIEQALAFYEQGGYWKEVSQAKLLRGHAKLQKGDYEAALEEFNQQLEFVKRAADPVQVARSHILIGSLLADQELYEQALHHHHEGRMISETIGNNLNVGYGLLNEGDMLWRLGRYNEAASALDQLPAVADKVDSDYKKILLARYHMVNAQIALSRRNFSEAIAEGQQALIISAEKFKRTPIETMYTLGLAQALSGLKREGRIACQKAYEMAPQAIDQRVLSNATLAHAEVLLETGDANKALVIAQQAQQRFERAGQKESEWQAWFVACRASQGRGNSQDAQEQSLHAKRVLSILRQKWGEASFKGYISRPDIRHSIRRLYGSTPPPFDL